MALKNEKTARLRPFAPIASLIIGCFLVFTVLAGRAQVPNNDIENRLPLAWNHWHASRTDGCTVQWNCVDEALTGKCIDYHNDQWFAFTVPPGGGPVYVSITRQTCRDVRGVQLVVMDGTPCQPSTYRILACVSLASQDDVYVQLDSLPPGGTYLLNVDGYLHDYCRFEIRVGGTPQGFPANRPGRSKAESRLERNRLTLAWRIDEEIASQIIDFQVYRRGQAETVFSRRAVVPFETNAAGAFREAYAVTDTVPGTGTWHYRIMAATPEGKGLLVAEHTQVVTPRQLSNAYLSVPLPYRRNTSVTVLLYDAETGGLLEKMAVTVKENNQMLRYFAGYLQEKNLRRVRVKTVDNRTGQARESVVEVGF